jgi:hypothetical protein
MTMTHTYIFKTILAQLSHEMEKANGGEPANPQDNLVQILHIYDAEHENKLVEDKIPKLIFHVLCVMREGEKN